MRKVALMRNLLLKNLSYIFPFRKEVPRMLLEVGQIDELEKYITSKNEKPLNKWWAQYLESNNRLDVAAKFYKLA